MNTVKEPESGTRIIDWQKSLAIILDHPIQTSLFIVTFAFLLLVEPPVLMSLLLLSILVYFIFALGERLARVADRPESSLDLTEKHVPTTGAAVAENIAAASATTKEKPRSPARRTTQRGSDSQKAQAKPQRSRQRASKNPQ
ncbi:hypothetical protein [Methylocaldum sp. RMAD-M]|uniref:hypothetical protein n=1 Tax=Methylocaldum sp. RMAD-M TaxID=2806557 RepID=UPI000A324579|nr:hypothetical protein [Methylocaldum sp. RMAD-M]MBP1151731.1 Na+-transporting methylmalonyl-CoA/oxaloacetate decarboxylase gamma subunit [Methylocaldum sp. RMAD-M]